MQPQPLYEQLTLGQLLNPNAPKIESALGPQLSNLHEDSSLQCLNNVVNGYADREKCYIRREQDRYLRNVVRSVHSGLVAYYRNEKSIGDLFDEGHKKDKNRRGLQCYERKKLDHKSIHLQRKYNVSLSIKYATLKEAEDIAQLKENKRYNREKMTFSKQPLIQQMKGLLKKNKENECQSTLSRNVNFNNNSMAVGSLPVQKFQLKRKTRNTDKYGQNMTCDLSSILYSDYNILTEPLSHLTLGKQSKQTACTSKTKLQKSHRRERKTETVHIQKRECKKISLQI